MVKMYACKTATNTSKISINKAKATETGEMKILLKIKIKPTNEMIMKAWLRFQ